MKRHSICCALIALAVAGGARAEQPNIVIIFTDDLGYGDLGVYGHPTISTPSIDRMAAEGMRFTQFYSAAPLCTPSRAALLTGRLPVRSGIASESQTVFWPDSINGLPAEEITIAELLREQGYATAMIGKWHLGHRPQFLPTSQGFDSYFGIPYSNDMDRTIGGSILEPVEEPKIEYWNVPLMRNEAVIERPADQRTITRRYTEEAVRFIRAHREQPFFLYVAHMAPHVPLFRSEAFAGVSARGLYGDVVEELDWSTGRVLDTLRDEGLADNTLVFFTSDNGPWLPLGEQGGSAGLLYGGKSMTWDGGVRVPAIAWWPGTIAAGAVETTVATTMDLFTTAVMLAGAEPPGDRIVDGRDIRPLLEGEDHELADDAHFFYHRTQLHAVRKGPWKAHFVTDWAYAQPTQYAEHDPPLLFNLEHDPGERHNVAAAHPAVIAEMLAIVAAHRANLVTRPDQLAARGAVQ